MSYAFTPIAIPYLIALILAGFISIYAFVFFERTRTNLFFVGLTSSLTVWILGTLLEILATTKNLMIFWNYFRFIGINLAAVFFLLFCFSFTYFAPRLFSRPINIIVFFIPGIIDYFFLITNEYHNLFFEELSIHPTAPFPALYRVYGIFFLFHFSLNALFIGAGVITLVLVYRRSYQQTYRRQIQLILSGVFIFVFIAIIYHFRIFPATDYLDITPLGYIVTCFLFLFGIREYHLIDIVPIAHQVIIANLTNTGVIVTDINKRVIEINPKAREYLFPDYNQGVIGKELFPLLYSQEHLSSQILDTIREIEQNTSIQDINSITPMSYEINLISPIEYERKYLKIVVETLQERERPIGTIFFLLDITAEKEIQEATRKSDDLRDSLLGVISHDLKNELFVISGFIEVIREELEKYEDKKELVEFISGIDIKVKEATSIIADVRDYLKALGAFDTDLKISKIDLKEHLNSVISSFETLLNEKGLTLNKELSTSEIVTLADLRIRSVFSNLLDNAIKWSPRNGIIDISISEQNQFWIIKISDQGSGVPDELKKVIFKPFTSFGEIGSGLGLALVSDILNYFNGQIWVEDNDPTGACFYVKLPIFHEKKAI